MHTNISLASWPLPDPSMHHSAQGSGEPWKWESKIDEHQGTYRKMEGRMKRGKLKKEKEYYLLYTMVLILVLVCVIRPFAVCVKCFLRVQRVSLTLDF